MGNTQEAETPVVFIDWCCQEYQHIIKEIDVTSKCLNNESSLDLLQPLTEIDSE